MATPEGLIKNSIMEYLTYVKGGIFWVNDSVGIFDPVKRCYRKKSKYHRNGVSDILGLYLGRAVAIEVKTQKGRLSPDQKKFIEDFKLHGGIAFVARSVDDVVRGIQDAVGTGHTACYTGSINPNDKDG